MTHRTHCRERGAGTRVPPFSTLRKAPALAGPRRPRPGEPRATQTPLALPSPLVSAKRPQKPGGERLPQRDSVTEVGMEGTWVDT